MPTNGVAAVKTTGKADSPIAARAPADSQPAPVRDYPPLTIAEARDLTCMLAGAPWPDEMLPELLQLLAIYDNLRSDKARPVDPASLPSDMAQAVISTGRNPAVSEQTAEPTGFWEWVRQAYRAPESTSFTVHNMAVAYRAGRDADRAARAQADSQPAPVRDESAARDECKRQWLAEDEDCNLLEAYDRGWKDRAASAPADSVTAPAGGEIDRLRAALVYVAFALHGKPQYMLAEGIALIDGDTVRVSRDGWTVEASINPARATPPAQAADSVLEDAARLLRQILAASQDGDSDTHLSAHFVSRIETITKAGGAA